MLHLISAVQQSGSVTHICTLFSIFFSIMVYHRILNIVPVLYSGALLFIHPIYNSLHLLISDSHATPPSPLALETTSLFSIVYKSISIW